MKIVALSCSRCGAPVTTTARFCLRCGLRIATAENNTGRDLFGGTATATEVQHREAAFIDAVVPGGLILASVITAVAGRMSAGVPAAGFAASALLVLAYLIISFIALGRFGRTLGRTMLGLRTVDSVTATPLTIERLARGVVARAWLEQTVTFDTKRGRDPMSVAFAPLAPDALTVSTVGSTGAASSLLDPSAQTGSVDEITVSRVDVPIERSAVSDGAADMLVAVNGLPTENDRAVSLTVVLDSGQRFELAPSAVIGRNPAPVDDVDGHATVAIADLSRTLSKTHALLEWDSRELWVTDLGSSNGTGMIGPDGDVISLQPHARIPVPTEWTVAPGERTLTFLVGERRGE